MTTYAVSYFKNHALSLLDDVAVKGESLLITRRGKPLAHVRPVKAEQGVVFGKLRGTMEINEDIVAPMGGLGPRHPGSSSCPPGFRRFPPINDTTAAISL